MKAGLDLYMVYVLAVLSIASFVYAAYIGFTGEYQESVFLFGIGFVVLAQVMFAYRLVRYPDTGIKQEDTPLEEPSPEAE
jgi:hypothetical protein